MRSRFSIVHLIVLSRSNQKSLKAAGTRRGAQSTVCLPRSRVEGLERPKGRRSLDWRVLTLAMRLGTKEITATYHRTRNVSRSVLGSASSQLWPQRRLDRRNNDMIDTVRNLDRGWECLPKLHAALVKSEKNTGEFRIGFTIFETRCP